MNDITNLLSAIEHGDPDTAERLWPLIYYELHRLAAAQMSRRSRGRR